MNQGIFGFPRKASFTKAYDSAIPHPNATTWVSFAHTLGEMPDLVVVTFVCTSADQGYSVGEELEAMPSYFSGGWVNTNSIVRSSSVVSVPVYIGSRFVAADRTTPTSSVQLDPTKWSIRVRAYA